VAHDALRVDGQDVEKHEHPWASTPDVLLFARSRAAGCHICSAIAGRECTGHLPGHAVLRFTQPENVKVPVLVLGAQHDRAILAMDVQTTACAYRTEAEIFPDMGHDMMLEPGWAAVAERIHRWLETHCNVADSVDRPMDVSPGTNSERDTAPGP
jgi:pimeloyl-ACP methyl ester carboxylesterase